jgi:3-oxoacyl-[acyl-carrier protein] reductase
MTARLQAGRSPTGRAASAASADGTASSSDAALAQNTGPPVTLPPVDLGLESRVALVTGASRGIGLGIARELAGEGASVAISSRSEERIGAAAAEIGARGYVHDSADLHAAPALVERVEADLGPLDVLVTNTGGPPAGASLEFERDTWEAAYRDLVLAPLALIERAVPGMCERGFGRILNVASAGVREPINGLILSNAHRTAAVHAFKTLARELAGEGITLNTLLPGRIATDRLVELYGSLEQAEEVAAKEVAAGRLGSVEEMAAAAAFLCSERAGYITGVALLVDGGLSRSV